MSVDHYYGESLMNYDWIAAREKLSLTRDVSL